MNRQQIGKKLIQARESKEFTRNAFRIHADMHYSIVKRLEEGTHSVTLDGLCQYSEAIKMPLSEILTNPISVYIDKLLNDKNIGMSGHYKSEGPYLGSGDIIATITAEKPLHKYKDPEKNKDEPYVYIIHTIPAIKK